MKNALIALGAVLILGGALWYLQGRVPESTTAEGCSTEVKRCPDGTDVGRVGPSCDFAACPSEDASKTSQDASTQSAPKPTTQKPTQSPTSASNQVTARFNEKVRIGSLYVTTLQVMNDDRCPSDAQCVSATGTINLQIKVQTATTTKDTFIGLGKTVVAADGSALTLKAVSPLPKLAQPVSSTQYRFTYEIVQ